jgi:hypothetical protein
MTEYERILVCGLVEHNDEADMVPGSIRGKFCTVCAGEVWVSPSGQRAGVADDGIVCTLCAIGLIATDGDPHIVPVSAAQREELRGQGLTDQEIDRARRLARRMLVGRRKS